MKGNLVEDLAYYAAVTVFGGLALLFVVAILPIKGNIEVKTVQSGSMEPSISTGSIVIIKPATAYKAGDVITFGEDSKDRLPTTHRIVEVRQDGGASSFVTKGDANSSIDRRVVHLDEVIGKVIFHLPILGYILSWVRTPAGFLVCIGLPVLIIATSEIKSLLCEVRKKKERDVQTKTD